ncbi:hypothetical protein [Kitasatospora sp. NPDC088134]|uniref:hypothetical protein n=1 Tax=Kitasatospora sp. NPDC088134 TaxID=3364071 RepID=UPI0038144826
MSLDTHVHRIRCDISGCLASFAVTIPPGAPDGTAYDQAERLGWQVRKFELFDPLDDPFAPPEEDRCPACRVGRGPVTATGTCPRCGGRTAARTGDCRWCGQPASARDDQETPR